MRLRRFYALIAAALWLTAVQAVHAQQPAPGDSTRAVTAARNWLSLVDSARWQMSLDSASDLFRRIVGSPANWQQFATTARARYPVVGERKLATWEASFSPEGAPDGRYARATFDSSSGARVTRETVVLVLTPTGWRVAMYGISGG